MHIEFHEKLGWFIQHFLIFIKINAESQCQNIRESFVQRDVLPKQFENEKETLKCCRTCNAMASEKNYRLVNYIKHDKEY